MTSQEKPISIFFIEMLIFSLFTILLINDFFKFVLGIDLIDILFNDKLVNWFKHSEDASGNIIDSSGNNHKKETKDIEIVKDEVFNIRNNLYTYDEAKSVCSIYGAKVATYDQVEDAYNHGGEWCNYGWTEGQMALFPTQKTTWNKLQASDKTKHACGRPGINGGYMKNPTIRFGVNCYGKKPDAKLSDKNLMDANKDIKVPESKSDQVLNAKINIWKENADKFLLVNSFNRKDWSEF